MCKSMHGCFEQCCCNEINKVVITAIVAIALIVVIYLITKCIIICVKHNLEKNIHDFRKCKAEKYSRDCLFEADELLIVKNEDDSYSVKKLKK